MHIGAPALCAGDCVGRSSDFRRIAHLAPSRELSQWHVPNRYPVTAAGTVADSRRIPLTNGQGISVKMKAEQ